MTTFDLAGATNRMAHFISAFINERAARAYLQADYAISDILNIEDAEESTATQEWLVAELTDSLDERNHVEERYDNFVDRTHEALLDVNRQTRFDLAPPRVLEDRHDNFFRWVAVDPVGAALFVADMLERAHEAVRLDLSVAPDAAEGSLVTQPPDSPANQSLRKAADAALRLAEELAAATGEPFEQAKAEIEQWRTTQPSLASLEPLGLYETSVESMFPERADTRKWLENLPLAQISALAEGLRAVSGGAVVGRRLDQATAHRAWPFLRELNGHLITGAAEALKADPRPEFPVASLERLRKRHYVSPSPAAVYLNAMELSPAAYVDLIEREYRRISPGALANPGQPVGLDWRSGTSSFLLPPSHAAGRPGERRDARPPWPPSGIVGLPSVPPHGDKAHRR